VAAYLDLHHSLLVLGHVGDSRCYRYRDGRLELLTQDHTLINEVLELRPDIDPSTAKKLPRNVITNALGMDKQVRVSVRTHEVAAGDRYLLCSDGLTDEVDDGQIGQALKLASNPEEQVRLLIDLAVETARDNVACVVLSVSLAPGLTTLPEAPTPPRRRYPEAHDAILITEEDDEPPEVVILYDEDDAPPVETKPAATSSSSSGLKKARNDETKVTPRENMICPSCGSLITDASVGCPSCDT
jgi:PPM family protein phosphatase